MSPPQCFCLMISSASLVLDRSRKKTGTSADIVDSDEEESGGGGEGKISKQEKQRRRFGQPNPSCLVSL